MDDVEYMAESLYDPNAYIVDGFNPGMIAANKPPVSLSDLEILCVIAYLQNLGGTPSVTLDTKLEWQGSSPPPAAGGAATAAAATSTGQSGEQLMQTYACVTCHKLDGPDKLIGPSLYDVGNRLSQSELFESVLDPDASVTEGFDAGIMGVTLDAMSFSDKISARDLKTMIDYLASKTGNQ